MQGRTFRMDDKYPIHLKTEQNDSFERLEKLWERYPQFHEVSVFTTLDGLLEEHESYQKDFDDTLKEEYLKKRYDRFLVQLSWSDLPYRRETKRLIEGHADFPENPYVKAFMEQFSDLSTDREAAFLFPESFASQFFVVMEACKRARKVRVVKPIFPDEEKVHYLAVFDKKNMDDVLLMFHLLYTNASDEVYGGYSLYDYSLPWYQTHLWQDGIVLRSPYLPDRLAKFQGNLPFFHNPAKTVAVRRNVEHMLECGYFSSELEFFLCLTKEIMPLFQWWYEDLLAYEEKDGIRTNWRLERTKIRTNLTADGIIKPKWKHELSLFHEVRKAYPDVLYQYRPDWLGRQSLDLYVPSIKTAIEYQGIQHYHPVDFFGGEEALAQRRELDETKRRLCEENGVRLIEWTYELEPTAKNVKAVFQEPRNLTES